MSQQLSFWGYDEYGIASVNGRRVVYFVACGDFVKIGFTTRDISERIAELSTGNPEELELIGTLFISKDQDDRELHRRFAKFHYRNEWFRKTPELVTEIATLTKQREIVIDYCDLDLSKPFLLGLFCPACNHEWRQNPRPVEVIGVNKPGAILGATICDVCDTPFSVRVKTKEETEKTWATGIRLYPDGSFELIGDWTEPDDVMKALAHAVLR